MGLFRRGTKLLRLGSGLRDCCCRPEQPEECWCPDWCSYYWTFSGFADIESQDVLNDASPCEDSDHNPYLNFEWATYGAIVAPVQAGDSLPTIDVSVPPEGLETGAFSTLSGSRLSGEYGVQGFFAHWRIGRKSASPLETIFYYHDTEITIDCESRGPDLPPVLVWKVSRLARVTLEPFAQKYRVFDFASGTIPDALTACATEPDSHCDGVGYRAVNITEEIAFRITESGVEVNGSLSAWDADPSRIYDSSGGWEVENEYPGDFTFTLKRREQPCAAPAATAVILTSGSSYEVPEGTTTIKAWAIGSGGVGETGRAGGGAGFTYFNIPGNAGGIAYKTWNSVGGTISYSVGDAKPASTIADGEATTVTYDGVTITGGGGTSSMPTNLRFPNNYVASTFSGGDGGAAGGRGDLGQWGDYGQSGGAVGGNGIRQACGRLPATDVSGLFAAVTEAAANNGIDKAVEDCGLEPAVGSGSAEDKFGLPFAAGYGGGGIWTAGEYAGTPSGSGAVVLLFE